MPDNADEHATPKGVTGSVHLVRAGAVVVCFLVALVLLLGPASRGILAAPGKAHHPTHPTQPVNKSTTRVQVANGSGTQGAAGTVSSQLQTLGWLVLPAETAAVHPGHWIVYFAPGHQLAAKEVARSIGVPHQHVVVRTAQIGVRGANQDDVIVVIGHSLRG
jgi:hypothetical protein